MDIAFVSRILRASLLCTNKMTQNTVFCNFYQRNSWLRWLISLLKTFVFFFCLVIFSYSLVITSTMHGIVLVFHVFTNWMSNVKVTQYCTFLYDHYVPFWNSLFNLQGGNKNNKLSNDSVRGMGDVTISWCSFYPFG